MTESPWKVNVDDDNDHDDDADDNFQMFLFYVHIVKKYNIKNLLNFHIMIRRTREPLPQSLELELVN